jgi:hypothetical protein
MIREISIFILMLMFVIPCLAQEDLGVSATKELDDKGEGSAAAFSKKLKGYEKIKFGKSPKQVLKALRAFKLEKNWEKKEPGDKDIMTFDMKNYYGGRYVTTNCKVYKWQGDEKSNVKELLLAFYQGKFLFRIEITFKETAMEKRDEMINYFYNHYGPYNDEHSWIKDNSKLLGSYTWKITPLQKIYLQMDATKIYFKMDNFDITASQYKKFIAEEEKRKQEE